MHRIIATSFTQVLRDFPRGLTVKSIVDEIERRGLRSFEGKANPTGQVCPLVFVDTLNARQSQEVTTFHAPHRCQVTCPVTTSTFSIFATATSGVLLPMSHRTSLQRGAITSAAASPQDPRHPRSTPTPPPWLPSLLRLQLGDPLGSTSRSAQSATPFSSSLAFHVLYSRSHCYMC